MHIQCEIPYLLPKGKPGRLWEKSTAAKVVIFIQSRNMSVSDQQRYITCYAYALGTFGTRLEKVAGKSMEELQKSVAETDIGPIVRKYFENVTEPRDGDLVIYSHSPGKFYHDYKRRVHSGIMHAGIYRVKTVDSEMHEVLKKWRKLAGVETESDIKPFQCECVESKWGVWRIPYVFEHEVFFMSPSDGDVVTFYRLKE